MSSDEPEFIIAGERVALGPLRNDLAAAYARWMNQLEVRRGLDYRGIATSQSQETWVEDNIKRGAEDEPQVVEFTVYDRRDSTAVGTAGLLEIAYAHGTAGFGIFIGERRGQGSGLGDRRRQTAANARALQAQIAAPRIRQSIGRDGATIRAMLEQHFASSDPDLSHAMYHDDAFSSSRSRASASSFRTSANGEATRPPHAPAPHKQEVARSSRAPPITARERRNRALRASIATGGDFAALLTGRVPTDGRRARGKATRRRPRPAASAEPPGRSGLQSRHSFARDRDRARTDAGTRSG